MSVLVKGKKMPKNCTLCFLRDDLHDYCPYEANKEKDCPLVEVNESPACDYARLGMSITRQNSCNDCGNEDCGYKPDYGDNVRWNCPLWRGKGGVGLL